MIDFFFSVIDTFVIAYLDEGADIYVCFVVVLSISSFFNHINIYIFLICTKDAVITSYLEVQ